MFRLKIFIISMLILICSFTSYGGMVPKLRVEGVITELTPNEVVLYKEGNYVKVPRSTIPKYFKIKSGQQVFAIIDSSIIKDKVKKSRK